MRKDISDIPHFCWVKNFGGRLCPEKWSSLDLRANPSKDDGPAVAYPLANSEMVSLSIDTLTKIYPAPKLETA